MAGRSSIERLPPGILADVHEAIREGATIDGITERIRALGGSCSRSAVCRYVRRARAVLQRRREVEGLADLWLGTPGDRAEGDTGRRALEALRALAMRSALALAMQRIEGAGRSGADREGVSARNPERKGFGRFAAANRSGGISPETVAHIRAAVEGYWGQGTAAVEEGEAAVQAYWEKGIHHADAEPAERQDRHTPAARRLGSP